MPNLKDTDFDDLFRRASDKYPLRTNSSDWDRMAAALEKDPSPTPDEFDNTDRRRRRRFFWWFLLLPLAGIGYYTIHPSGKGGHGAANVISTAGTPASNAAVTKPAAADHATDKNANNTKGATKRAADGGAAKSDPSLNAVAKNNTTDKTTAIAPTPAVGPAAGAAGSRPAEGPSLAPGMPHKSAKGALAGGQFSKAHGNIRSADGDAPLELQKARNAQPQPQTAGTNRTKETDEHNNGNDRFADKSAQIDPRTNPVAAAFTLRNTPINQQRARIADPYALNVKVNAPTPKKDSAKPKPKTKSNYLYAGIVAAPDLSTVKFQKTKGVGTTFGVLIGYAFNSHWAIETGAYVDRKKYYTDGEYFSTKKIYMPPNTYLQNVDGTCYMWEIPLNVRYTFNPQGKTRWFATAGLSTYLMNREKYTAQLENSTQSWPHTWDLKTPSQYPFSIIGFSAGFEQRLGNVGNLRIEPYVRVPLGGIGTGSLPILSTGINIGITKRLWK